MKFDSLSYSPLFENTLVRVISEFNSDMTPSNVLKGLSKALKRKVSTEVPGSYNVNISRGDDGVYRLETTFLTYRDSRLLCLNLFSWIERNGFTEKNNNFFVDINLSIKRQDPSKELYFSRESLLKKSIS